MDNVQLSSLLLSNSIPSSSSTHLDLRAAELGPACTECILSDHRTRRQPTMEVEKVKSMQQLHVGEGELLLP